MHGVLVAEDSTINVELGNFLSSVLGRVSGMGASFARSWLDWGEWGWVWLGCIVGSLLTIGRKS